MKKLFLMFAAVAALFATSCVTDTTSDVAVTGGECDVTLSVVAPGADSRTIGDGLKATKLVCGVYDAAWNYLTSVPGEFTGSTTTTLSMRLVKGKKYNFVFWAQAEGAPYTLTLEGTDNPTIEVDYSNVNANNDKLDAFYGRWACTVNGTINETITLTRPFAQINFGAADMAVAKEFGFDVTSAEATTTVTTMAYTTLSLRTDIATDEEPVTFKAAALPEDNTLLTNKGDYYWLAMNYILVPGKDTEGNDIETSLAQCDLTVEIPGQVPVVVNVPMAPAKRNWRTNLVGSILTEQGNLTIEIKPMPEGELPDESNPLHQLVVAAYNGGEVTLTEDVVTPHTLVVSNDMTIDLGGKTLSIDNTTRSASASDPVISVQKGAKLIVKNGTIKSEVVNGGATIYNEGTVVLMDGANIVGAPISSEKEYPSYCIRNAGNLTIEEGVTVSADRGCLYLSGEGETVINGGTLRNNDISDKRESFTSHVIVIGYGANNKLTINDGTFQHLHTKTSGGVVVNNWSAVTVDINGGDFRGGNYFGKWDNLSDYGYGSTKTPFCVKGGSFSGFDNKFLAAGYKAVSVDGLYYVLPAVVADAATAENVTSVTESVADVTTALATDNSEATLFTWNDVAYIAKYGEVVITSAAEEATTARGVVSNENNDPNHPLTSAVIAEGVTNLGDRTFRRCYNLESVVLPSTLTTIGETGSGVFQACSSLKNIVLPESLTLLGVGTFQECTSLESINIPAGITRIEENCLRNTGLVEVEFHEGVTYFGAQAFRDCKQLKKVVIKAPKFTVEPNAFGVMSSALPGTIIYVENAEMKAYLESTLSYKSQFTVIAPEVVNSAVELNAAINTIADGGILVLGADFNFTTEEGGYYNNGGWRDGLGYSGDKSFTLDLNGHTLGNANGALNDYLVWFKNDGEKPNTITIKNGTLDAGTTAFCAIATSSSNKQTITINLEDVNLVNNNSSGAVAKIRAGAVLNVKAGTKITGKNSYTGIECVASTVNIYEGAELYQNGTSSSWGFLAGASWGGVINVYGGKGVSARGGFMAMTSGGTVNVHGGEWVANVDGTIGDNSNLYVLSAQNNKYESGYKGASIVNVTGGTFRGGMDAWILNDANVEKAELNISGGNFNANPTHYLTDGATATESNGVWTVE